MKFGQYLKGVSSGAPPSLHDAFIDYKRLKKMLHADVGEPGAAGSCNSSAKFLADLKSQLMAVNRVFVREGERAIKEKRRLMMRGKLRSVILCSANLSKTAQQADARALHSRVAWVRRYANVNALALRKICKKHDKLRPDARGAGASFLQQCWCPNDNKLGAILHSPLLQQLAALQAFLSSKVASTPVSAAAAAAAAPPVCGGGRGEDAEAADPHRARSGVCSPPSLGDSFASSRLEQALRCSICLEPLFKPVGLSCGHRYCLPCVKQVTGMSNVMGPLRAVMQYVPATMGCPECRQTGVFAGAMRLKEMDSLIKLHFAQEWRQRAAEMDEQQDEMLDMSGSGRRLSESSSSRGSSRHRRDSFLGMFFFSPFDVITTS